MSWNSSSFSVPLIFARQRLTLIHPTERTTSSEVPASLRVRRANAVADDDSTRELRGPGDGVGQGPAFKLVLPAKHSLPSVADTSETLSWTI